MLLVGRLAVPVGVQLHPGHALPLDRVRHDHGGATLGLLRLIERVEDPFHVVAVDLDHVPPEGLPLLDHGIDVQDVHDLVGLLDLVLVEDHAQVRQAVLAAEHGGLPQLSGLGLAVADHAVDPPVGAVEPPGDGHAHGHRQALPERPRGRLDAGAPDAVGVALQGRAELPEGPQLVVREEPPLRERGVDDRDAVALRQDEPVAVRPVGVLRPDAQLVEV